MLEVQRTRDVQLANEELQQRLWQAEHLNQTLTLQNEELARANKSTEKKLVEMQARLDGKIAELKDAATFLSMTDDVPDSEVERIVQALNANIFQTAARISDEPRLSSRRQPVAVKGTAQSPSEWIPVDLFDTLCSVKSGDVSAVIQLAGQCAMVQYVLSHITSSWDLGTTSGQSVLDRAYGRIQSRGAFLFTDI